MASRYTKIIQAWPKDPLRPTVSFAKALEARAAAVTSNGTAEREAGFLQKLLDNTYQKKYSLSPKFTTPASNPSYYTDLMTELEQAPNRSWFSRKIEHWKGMLRFQ